MEVTEVTKEIKLRVCGLYLDAPCLIMGEEDPQILVGVSYFDQTVDFVSSVDSVDTNWADIVDVQLILNNISDITDEHAIEVVKLLVQHGKVDINDLTIFITNRTDEKVLLRVGGIKYHLYYNGNILCTSAPLSSDEQTIYLPIYNTSYVTDYLRSQGYMLPYLGLDLFAAGIAITPTESNPKNNS